MKIDFDAVRTLILEGKNKAWNLVIEILNGDRATANNLEVKGDT
jgi:hypothetical protein